MNAEDVFFPHAQVREIQDQLIEAIMQCLEQKKNLVVHAPTGLGKTAAAASPSLKFANDHGLVIFFLTSRQTQHRIAFDTALEIRKKYKLTFNAVDIIGKKWFCLQPNVQRLASGDFHEYCRKMREDGLCEFYTNLRKGEQYSSSTVHSLRLLRKTGINKIEQVIALGREQSLCPYEVSVLMAKDARMVIADYYYIFSKRIRENFFNKLDLDLEKVILIIDEAHNLPARIKELASQKLSTLTLNRAIYEAKKYQFPQLALFLKELHELFRECARHCDEEIYVKKDEFVERVSKITQYDDFIDALDAAAGEIREKQQSSSLGSVAGFLDAWKGDDDGYTRILSKKKGLKDEIVLLSYQCLDPAKVAGEVINQAHSSILMSGTLTPTAMFKELLGVERCEERTFKSPFPKKNRLNLIIPKTTTRYEIRGEEEFRRIAEVLGKVIDAIPGNSAVYFPSYFLRDEISQYIVTKKTVFSEDSRMNKTEKEDMLERFKQYKDIGATLLAVITGNFGEGIDLPGDFLKGVVIVGLPLQKPDLETRALIEYFDKKFQKGWDYGYLFPAFTRAMQSAGRCIRSGTDKGVVIFLDERYTWKNYYRCFPADWDIRISLLYEKMITEFFENNS
ncbi:MAG: ATP-dependent DNA helicase [Nanoarchaeota archaeon]